MTYIPKGFMCCVCIYLYHKCNHLYFNLYKPMGKPDLEGFIEVKCINFVKRINKEISL